MRKLDDSVRKNGYTYSLIERNDFKAIYSQHLDCGKLVGHEVFRIKIGKEAEVFGKTIPLREKFPSDNDFGVSAWSVGCDIARAMARYNELSYKSDI